MGVTEILTIIFVVLKLNHTIDWSWWSVLLPEIIAAGVAVIWFFFVLTLAVLGIKGGKR